MVVVVTGARGFLGSRVAQTLGNAGWRVVEAGRPVLEIPSRQFDEALAAARPDLVVHCAGPASVQASLDDPASDRRGSVGVTSSLLRSLEKLTPAPRLLLVSSAAVYGDPGELPISESTPVAPISPYGRHRLETEQLTREANIPTSIIRVFSAYGEGLRRRLLWEVAQRASAETVVELWGTGRESRDFVHVDDVAQGVASVAAHAPFSHDVYNVGSGTETTIETLATTLLRALGSQARLHFRGVERAGDPLRWCADVSALRALHWSPCVGLDEGVARYAAWVRSAT